MTKFFSIFLIFLLASVSKPAISNDLFGNSEGGGLFGDILKEMNEVAADLDSQMKSNSGTNSDVNNQSYEQIEYSTNTRQSVGAPVRCPNWNSAQMLERNDARERYPFYQSWHRECSKYYPDAEPVPEQTYEECVSMFGDDLCQTREQLTKLQKMKEKSQIDYLTAVVKIAEAIGLKENAAGLRATLEFLDSEGLEGTREYEDRFEIAFTQTIALVDEMEQKIAQGVTPPTAQEVALIEEAARLKNDAGIKWAQAVKERDKLIQQGGLAGAVESTFGGIDDFQFFGMANRVDETLVAYNNTVSKNIGKDLDIEDGNYEEEFDSMVF